MRAEAHYFMFLPYRATQSLKHSGTQTLPRWQKYKILLSSRQPIALIQQAGADAQAAFDKLPPFRENGSALEGAIPEFRSGRFVGFVGEQRVQLFFKPFRF